MVMLNDTLIPQETMTLVSISLLAIVGRMVAPHVLIPKNCECDIIWKKCLCRYNKGFSRWDHSESPGWALKPRTSVLTRDVRGKDREKSMGRQRQKLGCCSHKSRNDWSHPVLEEARKDFSLEFWEEVWPCWRCDFRFWCLELWENKFLLF